VDRHLTVVDAGAFPRAAADRIGALLEESVSARGDAAIALVGGSTPRPVYAELARRALPWDRLRVYFGDERAVPPDDPESNYHMACETLLAHVPIPASQVHRMDAEAADPEAAARAYELVLPERLDLLLLGIGEDGHTASLFPGSPVVAERERRVRFVVGPKPPPRRLTITPPVIAAARATVMLAAGAAKAAAVARALEGPDDPARCPACLARDGTWILDQPAAAGLAGGGG
jgi:6-phosphogluconolactonase